VGALAIDRSREACQRGSPEEIAVPIGFLTDAERERLDSFPTQVVPGNIEIYSTLSRADRRQIPRTSSLANRLGFALQLGALRFLGFCPDDLGTVPEAAVAFVARQLTYKDAFTRIRAVPRVRDLKNLGSARPSTRVASSQASSALRLQRRTTKPRLGGPLLYVDWIDG
jgi:hypothetical protein